MTHRSVNRTLVKGSGFIWVKNYKHMIRCNSCLKDVRDVAEFKYGDGKKAYFCFDCSQKYLQKALDNLKLIEQKGMVNFFKTMDLLNNI